MHADFYELPDEIRIDISPNSSNQKIMALEKVSLDTFAHLIFRGDGFPLHQPELEGPTHV
jgi:hypothetical protein